MLKKLLLAACVAVPMLASAQTLKIGIVDVQGVIQVLPEYTAAEQRINDVSKRYQDEYTKLGEEMQRKYEEFQNLPDNELPAIRDRKARELQDYQQKIQQFMQDADQQLQKMQADEMAPIVSKVRDAIESVGKEGNFSLIQMLDPQLVLFHQSPVEDITPTVKAKLGVK